MVFSVVAMPLSSSFVSALFVQWMPAIVIGGFAVSAILSGWLRNRPRIQKFVTALAMAAMLAMAIYSAAHPGKFPFLTSPIISCDLFWWDPLCWLI